MAGGVLVFASRLARTLRSHPMNPAKRLICLAPPPRQVEFLAILIGG